MSRYTITSLAPKVEYDSPEWHSYQAGTTAGATKAVAPIIAELLELKPVLERMLVEKREQEARFVEYAAETAAFKERRRRRETAEILRWAERILEE